ncbi:MAG TPA: hypothetical protein RMG48_06460, partial [Myxococcales bacterium LLY-WYZ-16_1]|nr:hypothetical protein [Myxococcales bacterium LLY-WYZ-16_1]
MAVSGCGDGATRLRIETIWQDSPPEPGSVLIYGTVFSADRRTEANGGEPVPYEPEVQVPFRSVPFGADLVVEVRFHSVTAVEMAGGAEPEGPPLYFGRSEPFDFGEGDDRTVEVVMSLRRGPESDPGAEGLFVVNARNGRVATPTLQLRLRAGGADTIQVAQDLDFSLAARTFQASDWEVTTESESGLTTYELEYDLNETREDCASN